MCAKFGEGLSFFFVSLLLSLKKGKERGRKLRERGT
jgi:hypothetical protein